MSVQSGHCLVAHTRFPEGSGGFFLYGAISLNEPIQRSAATHASSVEAIDHSFKMLTPSQK